MIAVNNLSIFFSGRNLFNNIKFTISKNERLALIGKNGSGKTTLLRAIYGIISPESGTISTPKSYKIGFLQQELSVQSFGTLYEEVKSSLSEIETISSELEQVQNALHNTTDDNKIIQLVEKIDHLQYRFNLLGGNTIEAEIEQTLLGLGFTREEFYREVSSFSGGWRMRIELAKILLAKPDLIMLDEPTNHLDLNSLLWLEKFLRNYFGSIIIVSHDTNFLDNVTNRTIEISNGKLYDYKLPYSEFIEYRVKQREQQLAAFKSQQKEIDRIESFVTRFRYKATLATRVQSKMKMLEKIERVEIDDIENPAIDLRFPQTEKSSIIPAEAVNLSKKYGEKQVLSNLNFKIERGNRIAFVGKNGEGKSTLCKILAKNLDYEGKLYFGNYLNIQYYSQIVYDDLNLENTILEEVEKVATSKTREQVRTILGAFLFHGDDIFKKIKVLSGGEKSRVALCKIIVQPCNFLIMDEPTNHLDVFSKAVLKEALMNFEGTMIVVSHDRDFLLGLTNETWEIKNHQINIFLGDFEIYLEKIQANISEDLKIESKKVNQEEKSSNTNDYEVRKQSKRELEKYNREIKKLESSITELESKIRILEESFSNSEILSNPTKLLANQKEYDLLRHKLDTEFQKWEEINLAIEDLKG
jgi:ATP-binding cassette subfamily F protein 3